MPARTMAGAMQRAWLNAYRRTLSKTMEQARSMDQVVEEAGLDWLETPDQALVWSVALGLTGQVEDVLGRTLADSEASGTQAGFMPLWYRSHDGTSLAGGAVGGGGRPLLVVGRTRPRRHVLDARDDRQCTVIGRFGRRRLQRRRLGRRRRRRRGLLGAPAPVRSFRPTNDGPGHPQCVPSGGRATAPVHFGPWVLSIRWKSSSRS